MLGLGGLVRRRDGYRGLLCRVSMDLEDFDPCHGFFLRRREKEYFWVYLPCSK